MAVQQFVERLRTGPPIVADGGMGALISAAVTRLRCPEEANRRAPDSVVSVHVGYIRAGAELIETNTFGANRPKLAASFLEDDFERINSAGARLAREAREITGADVFIAGSIGPLGDVELRPESRAHLFAEEAQTLGGVTARRAGTRLAELGVAAIGANHGAGPASALAALADMRQDGLVLAA